MDRGADAVIDIGTTPLLRAARSGDVEAIKLLLEHGALVDLPQVSGATPLMVAVGLGANPIDTRGKFRSEVDALATAQVLLDAGADVNARAKNKFDNTPLHVSMLSQSSEVAKVLMAHGAEIDARMSEGATALHEAAMNGDAVSIRMLLDAGADPSLKMPNGKTALDLARKGKHQEAARVLQAVSAKVR